MAEAVPNPHVPTGEVEDGAPSVGSLWKLAKVAVLEAIGGGAWEVSHGEDQEQKGLAARWKEGEASHRLRSRRLSDEERRRNQGRRSTILCFKL
ncbi:hypothetical protein TRIUR3_18404 [Triticum urartu]|uniref:Uncharacterized protein n=1 Tax=Triticum urartu TaxID=4572 RepID=M7ZUS7_TRIUA|nr:hypothetical protein TRIUR3_18404 [Triticum urartu]